MAHGSHLGDCVDLQLSPGVPKFLTVCTICQGSLAEKGPSINCFSFGQLFKRGPKNALEKALLQKEFPGSGGGRRRYDTSKTLSTPCGHLFHSGCLREWFFVQRDSESAPMLACPFCQQYISLVNCRIVYPSSVEWSSMFSTETRSIGTGSETAINEGSKSVCSGNCNCTCVNAKLTKFAWKFFPLLGITWRLQEYFFPYLTQKSEGTCQLTQLTNIEETVEVKAGSELDLYWHLTAFVSTFGSAVAIFGGKRSQNRGWMKTAIAAVLFVASIYVTFESDLGIFDFGEFREVEEDEDLDKEMFVEKSYSWTLVVAASCLLAAFSDAFL